MALFVQVAGMSNQQRQRCQRTAAVDTGLHLSKRVRLFNGKSKAFEVVPNFLASAGNLFIIRKHNFWG